jgi:Flp pilus assembly protein TadG
MKLSLKSTVAALIREVRSYQANQAGNIGMILGLSIIPMILAAGSAIDFSRVANAKSNLISGLDSAGLYAATITGKTEGEMKTLAQNYLNANYTNASDAPLTEFDLKNYADRVVVTGKVNVKTWFMSVAGITNLDVPATSEISKSGSSVEVSLVLDQTGSMSGTKIANLKTAAKNFIDTVVWDQTVPYYSKVALVPFTFAVNPGTYAVQARGTIAAGTSTTPGSAKFTFNDASNAARTWNITNCVSERTGAQAYTDSSPAGAPVGRVYDSATTDCDNIPSIIPLTNDKVVLKTAIDNMVAGGTTAGQIGVAWGWYMISPDFGLWSGASAPGLYTQAKLKKIVVFMTDGEFNTAYCKGVLGKERTDADNNSAHRINCNSTNGDPTTQAQSLCTAMKGQNVTVYTIGFQLPTSGPSKTFMQNCATDSSKFFDAADSAALSAAFADIAKNLLDLRVSK